MTKPFRDITPQSRKELWKSCVSFHGHSCGGLAIGFQAAMLAAKLLDLSFSRDEETVCVAENDACGVDAISVILGCSLGKGNLLLRIRGKQVFSFFNRKTGQCTRLSYQSPPSMPQDDKEGYILNADPHSIFSITKPSFDLPEEAIIFDSLICESCGEQTAEPYIRLTGSKKVCTDCYSEYKRFF